MIIGGIAALIVAVVLLIVGIVQMSKLGALEEAKPCTAQELDRQHRKGGLLRQCSITGIVECETPITAPISQKACALYLHKIIREREEEYQVRDQNTGMTRTETRDVEDRLPDEERRVVFWVRDKTGRVLVDPRGAALELDEEARHFDLGSGMRLGSQRTKGLRYTEYILPVGEPGYIMGWATDREGRLMIGLHPTDRRQRFLISNRSHAELTKSAGYLALASLIGAVVLGFGGIFLIALYFL
jgi:hypothetical protein